MNSSSITDYPENFYYFFASCFLSISVGLILGGLVNGTISKIQNDDDDWKLRTLSRSFLFLVLQSSLNIILISIIIRTNKHFVSWFQLTVSGALFSVLLFSAQKNLQDNVLRLTNF